MVVISKPNKLVRQGTSCLIGLLSKINLHNDLCFNTLSLPVKLRTNRHNSDNIMNNREREKHQ